MTAESSTHTYESGVQETVTLRRGPATPHDCALLKITYSDGEIADCYVNTAWLRDRADHLTDTPRPLTADDMTFEDNHAGRDLARERLDGWKTEWERRIKAEKERDKARAGARLAFGRCREAQAERQKVVDELYRIRADEQPRPLTADDITDEMIDRALARWGEAKTVWAPRDAMREAMRAALTEPPSRPEGAEEIERLLTEDLGDFSPPATPEAIADLLAVRGVRATGGN